MGEPDPESPIAAAKAYEELFVPALFGKWASKVADEAAIAAGQSVLDVACGTGVLAREALRRTGPSGRVAGLDPSAGMLQLARELSPTIDWRCGKAESLPFSTASFDVVASQFGLMFMEHDTALREMLRVLKPGGRLVAAVWDDAANIPAYAAEIALLERIAGAEAANALRAPFVLGDRRVLARVFEQAGGSSLTVRTLESAAKFPSIRTMVEADLRGWLPVMGVHLGEEQIEGILEEAEIALGSYVIEGGPIAFPTRAHVVSVIKP